MEVGGIKLSDFLRFVRNELREYVKNVRKEEPIIAVLKEVTIAIQTSKVDVAEGGLKIFVAELSTEKTHTITLKFVAPYGTEFKSFSEDELIACHLMQKQKYYQHLWEKLLREKGLVKDVDYSTKDSYLLSCEK